MTEDTFRIKPLVWTGESPRYVARTPIGDYLVRKGQWWSDFTHMRICADSEEAKAAAEAHWRERLMQCLEKVE